MSFVPPTDVLNSTGVPVFFGCGNSEVATIVWVPNAPLTAAGGAMDTAQMQINVTQTESMVANWVAVMSQNDSDGWAVCLGCAIMEMSSVALPGECGACFSEYCYTE
jgi:lysophospholipase